MKRWFLLTLTILCVVPFARAQSNPPVVNPAIDMQGYLRIELGPLLDIKTAKLELVSSSGGR
jgi:hypothetical protein